MNSEINRLRRNTLGDLLRKSAKKYPDQYALSYYAEDGTLSRMTYAQLNSKANRFANAMRKVGVNPREVAAILSHNSIDFLVAAWGLVKANLTATYINVNLVDQEIAYQINHSDAVIVFVEDEYIPTMQRIAGELDQVKYFVALGKADEDLPPHWLNCETLMDDNHGDIEPEVSINDEDVAFRMYTSGTTAFPKGIDLTFKNAEYVARSYAQINGGEELVNKPFGYFLPLYHSGCLHVFAHHCNGSHLILGSASNLGKMVEVIHDEQVVVTLFPVIIFNRLIDKLDLMKKLTSLKRIWWFGGSMPLPTLKKWVDLLPEISVAAQWSQTECLVGTISWYNHGTDLPVSGSVIGKPYHDTEIMVVDEDDRECPVGVPGELVMRSPAVMSRYHKNPEATGEAFKSGWHHTGDVGVKGEDGFYYFVDRLKDMIKTGGVNVSAVEVETALNELEGINGSAVFSAYHPDWTEAVVAAVVLDDDSLDKSAIIAHCKKRLARFKIPKEIIFIDEIPTNHVGKILRKKLRDEYKDLFAKEATLN